MRFFSLFIFNLLLFSLLLLCIAIRSLYASDDQQPYARACVKIYDACTYMVRATSSMCGKLIYVFFYYFFIRLDVSIKSSTRPACMDPNKKYALFLFSRSFFNALCSVH
jgi:hypothetical protein